MIVVELHVRTQVTYMIVSAATPPWVLFAALCVVRAPDKEEIPARARKAEMSRYLLKGQEEGSEVAVGLDHPMQHWFWTYYPQGQEATEPEDQVWDNSFSHNDMMEAVKKLADMEHPLAIAVVDRIGWDYDPGLDSSAGKAIEPREWQRYHNDH